MESPKKTKKSEESEKKAGKRKAQEDDGEEENQKKQRKHMEEEDQEWKLWMEKKVDELTDVGRFVYIFRNFPNFLDLFAHSKKARQEILRYLQITKY